MGVGRLWPDIWRGLPCAAAVAAFYITFTMVRPGAEPSGMAFAGLLAVLVSSFAVPVLVSRPKGWPFARRLLVAWATASLFISWLIVATMDASFHYEPYKVLGGFILIWAALGVLGAIPVFWGVGVTVLGGRKWWGGWAFGVTAIVPIALVLLEVTGKEWEQPGDYWFDSLPTPIMAALYGFMLAAPLVWGWPGIRMLGARFGKALLVSSTLTTGLIIWLVRDSTTVVPGFWPGILGLSPFWVAAVVIQGGLFVAVIGTLYAARAVLRAVWPWLLAGVSAGYHALRHPASPRIEVEEEGKESANGA